MLHHMPPHIKEIADRRPDLVMQLLKQRQQRQMRQAAASRKINGSHNQVEEDVIFSDGSDDSDEMTSLIQRDLSDPPMRYKSLEKSL